MDGRGRGAHGEQPALQAERQDQRLVRGDGARARAARPREGAAGHGPGRSCGSIGRDGRGLPAEPGGPGQLSRSAPGIAGRLAEARSVDLSQLLALAGRRRGAAVRPTRHRTKTGPRLRGVVVRGPGEAPKRPGRRRARRWPPSCSPGPRRSAITWTGSPSAGRRSSSAYQKRLTERVQCARAGARGDRRAQGPDPRGRDPRRAMRHQPRRSSGSGPT